MVELGVRVRWRAEDIPMGPVLLEHFNEVEPVLLQFGSMTNKQIGQFFELMQPTGEQALKSLAALLAMHGDVEKVIADFEDLEPLIQQTRDLIGGALICS